MKRPQKHSRSDDGGPHSTTAGRRWRANVPVSSLGHPQRPRRTKNVLTRTPQRPVRDDASRRPTNSDIHRLIERTPVWRRQTARILRVRWTMQRRLLIGWGQQIPGRRRLRQASARHPVRLVSHARRYGDVRRSSSPAGFTQLRARTRQEKVTRHSIG